MFEYTDFHRIFMQCTAFTMFTLLIYKTFIDFDRTIKSLWQYIRN